MIVRNIEVHSQLTEEEEKAKTLVSQSSWKIGQSPIFAVLSDKTIVVSSLHGSGSDLLQILYLFDLPNLTYRPLLEKNPELSSVSALLSFANGHLAGG